MKEQYDVIVIGAGHNGLVCANALAEKGKKVLVLEAAEQVGGMAITCEFAPGFRASTFAHLLYGLHPKAQRYAPQFYGAAAKSLTPVKTLVVNQQRQWLDLDQSSHWAAFNQEMAAYSRILFHLSDKIPPRLKHLGVNDLTALLGAGRQLRKLSQAQQRKFLRIVGMNVYDLAQESLDDEQLKAALCFEAVIGSRLGPRAPNTTYNWLNRRSISNQQEQGICSVGGGLGALCEALADTARKNGVEIRTTTRVNKILVEDNLARGVELSTQTGASEQITARLVVSNADVKQTMLQLVGPQILETQIVRKVNHIPMQGTTAKLHIALDALPESFTGNQADLGARIIYADSADAIERSSNAIKYGEYCDQPIFEVTMPSLADPTLAPPNKHVMSVLVPYVPYAHKATWDAHRPAFEAQILDQLDKLLPGTQAATSKVEVLLPSDIEAQCHVTGGHWHHGEIGLERFMMLRPAIGFSQYATCVEGLYLCGAGCHPGGDVNGAAGLNAARAIQRRATL